jgi:hypothetical protein
MRRCYIPPRTERYCAPGYLVGGHECLSPTTTSRPSRRCYSGGLRRKRIRRVTSRGPADARIGHRCNRFHLLHYQFLYLRCECAEANTLACTTPNDHITTHRRKRNGPTSSSVCRTEFKGCVQDLQFLVGPARIGEDLGRHDELGRERCRHETGADIGLASFSRATSSRRVSRPVYAATASTPVTRRGRSSISCFRAICIGARPGG